MYEEGLGVEQNFGKAKEFFEQAHRAGHVQATCSLGVMYFQDLGVEQNFGLYVIFYGGPAAAESAAYAYA